MFVLCWFSFSHNLIYFFLSFFRFAFHQYISFIVKQLKKIYICNYIYTNVFMYIYHSTAKVDNKKCI